MGEAKGNKRQQGERDGERKENSMGLVKRMGMKYKHKHLDKSNRQHTLQ